MKGQNRAGQPVLSPYWQLTTKSHWTVSAALTDTQSSFWKQAMEGEEGVGRGVRELTTRNPSYYWSFVLPASVIYWHLKPFKLRKGTQVPSNALTVNTFTTSNWSQTDVQSWVHINTRRKDVLIDSMRSLLSTFSGPYSGEPQLQRSNTWPLTVMPIQCQIFTNPKNELIF